MTETAQTTPMQQHVAARIADMKGIPVETITAVTITDFGFTASDGCCNSGPHMFDVEVEWTTADGQQHFGSVETEIRFMSQAWRDMRAAVMAAFNGPQG